jgi:phospholipid/cholesterol/gamma-HCH transport system substrate-binding protein
MVVLLLFGLITVGLWLSEGFDNKTYKHYLVFMEEAVSGLSEGSLVRYNGVKVGFVKSINLDKNPRLVRLLLEIEADTPITKGTVANLISQGITGTTYLGLSVMSNDLTLLEAKPGCAYPVIPYKPSLLFQVEGVITEFSKSMKAFMSKENAENFKNILDNMEQFSNLLAANNKAFQETLSQMPKLTTEMRDSIARFGDMSHDMAVAGRQLNSTMITGKDALDVIAQQAVPPTISLLHRLDVIAGNIEQLSAELRRNPSALIRGAAPLRKGPGE